MVFAAPNTGTAPPGSPTLGGPTSAISPLTPDVCVRVFQVHGVNATGRVVMRRKLQRAEVAPSLLISHPPASSVWKRALRPIIGLALSPPQGMRSAGTGDGAAPEPSPKVGPACWQSVHDNRCTDGQASTGRPEEAEPGSWVVGRGPGFRPSAGPRRRLPEGRMGLLGFKMFARAKERSMSRSSRPMRVRHGSA